MAVPKRRKSKSKKGARHGAGAKLTYKAQKPTLTTLGSGKRVPRHTLTAANPAKKGVVFVTTKSKK